MERDKDSIPLPASVQFMCSSSDLWTCITAELNISLENVTVCHARLLNYSLDGHACGDDGFICSFPEVRRVQNHSCGPQDLQTSSI